MDLLKFLLVLSLLSIIPGQIIRIPILGSAVVTLSDIIVLFTALTAFVYLFSIKKSVKFNSNIIIGASIFSLIATASTLMALISFSKQEVLISSLFLLRFLVYFSISVVVSNVVERNEIKKWLNLLLVTSGIFMFFGFLQLLIFPDLRFLTFYGWDPHQMRIASTFIDPNYTGGYLSIIFAITLSLFLNEKRTIYLIFSLLIFMTIIFTFSRSSYLATLTVLIVIGFLKSPKLLIGFLIIFLFSFFTTPQLRSRVIGAVTFDETSKARIESWQKAITIFKKNPLFGVGFNTYRFAQSRYGFFSLDDPSGGHSGAGSDSSILLVVATTGLVGLASYLFFLFAIFKTFLKKIKVSALHLGALSAFLGLLVHSQFVNSLFFPQIMIILWFILGLAIKNDS